MSQVLSFLNAHPNVVKQLPGLCLFPDNQIEDVKAIASTVLEVEQENMAYEECHIILRLVLSADWEFERPVWMLEALRVSIEHGDHEPIAIPIGSLEQMKQALTSTCIELGCFRGSERHGFPLLKVIANLHQALPQFIPAGKVA